MEEYYYNRSRSYTCSNHNDRPSRPPAAAAAGNSVSNYELRSYSTSSYQVANYYGDQQQQQNDYSKAQQQKGKKKKDASGLRSWSVKDPELQRKKRVAGYKMYSAEGRVKGTFRSSFRWLKDGYTRVFYGWW